MIARSIGAAPRQRGSSDGCTFEDLVARQQRLAHERAVRAQAEQVGRQRRELAASVLEALGLARPRARARAPRPRAASARRAGRGRAGAGRPRDDHAGAGCERGGVEHRERERRGADVDDPHSRLALTPGAHRLAPLLAARAVEHQHAVEVVDLVLEHARLEPRRLDRQRRAVLVAAADAQVHVALDVDADAGDAQAALLARLGLLAVPLDARVDERGDRARRPRPGRRARARASRPASRRGRRRARRP